VRVIIVRVMILPVSSVRRAGLSQIDSLASAKRSVTRFQDNHLLLQFLERGCHMNFFPFTSGHGEKQ